MTIAQNKRTARKETFQKIGKAISQRANSPTAFNPHYNIAGRASQDPKLRTQGNTGPQLKTLQWEATTAKR